jgi:hypothetical protein
MAKSLEEPHPHKEETNTLIQEQIYLIQPENKGSRQVFPNEITIYQQLQCKTPPVTI